MATVSSNTNWHAIVIPWLGEIANPDPQGGAAYVLQGVKSGNFSRNKGDPSGTCNITVIGSMMPDNPNLGPGRPGMKVGDWMILYSNNNIAPNGMAAKENDDFYQATRNGVPRFFGQIDTIDSDFERDGNGRLRRVHSVQIKVWSSFLQIPVRYDTTAPALMLAKDGGASVGAEVIAGVFGESGKDITAAGVGSSADTQETLRKVAKSLFSAFAMAHLTLGYIDGISSVNQVQTLKGLGTKLPDVAVRMPAVPPDVFTMLGISGANPDRPFSTGMVTTVTGVQTGPIRNDGTWNGLYGSGEFTQQGTGAGFNQEPEDRPQTLGLQPLLCQGLSAWQIINSFCDMSVNEIFCDMTFELAPDGKMICPRPFIQIRDKPFALASLLRDAPDGAITGWTRYDDLPRIYVSSDFIVKAKLRRTMNGTASYIRLNFNAQEVGDPDAAKWASEAQATINNTALQKRFGGQELFLDTNFIAADPAAGKAVVGTDGGNAPWFKKLKNIVAIWHSYMYRMASCQLIMKDHNVALTLGYNLQFTVGGIALVGHIEGISADFNIDDEGKRSTNWIVNLSRVCMVDSKNELAFLPQELFSNLRET